jgi:hypothetical protein
MFHIDRKQKGSAFVDSSLIIGIAADRHCGAMAGIEVPRQKFAGASMAANCRS